MASVGVPELIIILFMSVVWIVPLVAGIWALMTLYKLRKGQDVLLAKVEALERSAQRPT